MKISTARPSIPLLPRTLGLFLIAALTTVVTATAQTSYSVIDLGVDVSPTDVNDNGEVVGSVGSGVSMTGFYFDIAGGLTLLPETRQALAISDQGDIVGSASAGGAFLITGGRYVDLGAEHTAAGINQVGQVAGSESKKNPYRATPLPTDAAIYDLLTRKWSALDVANVYPRGTRQGVYADLYRSNDINDFGFAVGTKSRYGLYGSSCYLVAPGDTTVTWLPIPSGGEAIAINNFNQVVGRTGVSGAYTAYVYDYDQDTDPLTDLGTLSGDTMSLAYDINDFGQVVGTSFASIGRGFIWQGGQMIDLNTLDLNTLIESVPPLTITSATAINERGDIAATGSVDGVSHGLLLITSDPNGGGDPGTNLAPIARIVTNRTKGRTRTRFAFDGTTSTDADGTIELYDWDFGDGSTGSGSKIKHRYGSIGTYPATLKVTDNQGETGTKSVTITVR